MKKKMKTNLKKLKKKLILLRGKSEVIQDLRIIPIPWKCVLDSWGSSVCLSVVCSLNV